MQVGQAGILQNAGLGGSSERPACNEGFSASCLEAPLVIVVGHLLQHHACAALGVARKLLVEHELGAKAVDHSRRDLVLLRTRPYSNTEHMYQHGWM